MKIAMVSDAIYPYNKGGKEKRIYEISTRLAKHGYDVHIYCMKWWKGSNVKIEEGVTLHSISRLYPLYSGKRRSIKQAVFFAISCFKLVREDFDVIDADHMPHLVLFPLKIISVLKRKRLIVTWNEVWGRKYWVEYMGIWGNLAFVVEWLSSKIPDEITSVSEHTKNKLVNSLGVKGQVKVVTNGIDFNYISQIERSKKKSDIIFAGRLLNHKNINVLISSIAILIKKNPKLLCLIVGEGPEKENLIEQVNKLKLEKNINFLNFLPSQEGLYQLMKSSRVFVLPSTREGFGLVALEANACGIPVVTINHKDNAAKDLIKDKNGIICRLDEIEIAKSITDLLEGRMKFNGDSDFAKSHDWNNTTRQIETIYSL